MNSILTQNSIGHPTGPAPVTDPTFIGTVTVPEIQFETPHTPIAPANGLTYWDDADKTLATILDTTAGVTLQHGQEMHVRCVNATGVQINDGQVVYVDDALGNRPTCALALANNHTTSRVIGVATQNIANNLEGYVTVFGIVRGYNTSGFTDGDKLYLSATTPGLLVNVAPTSPNLVVCVATALNSTINGSIFVNPQAAIDADASFTGASDLVSPGQLAVKTYIGHENTKEPTGFKDPELVVATYDSATRKITLTGTVEAYYRGVQIAALTSGWVSDAIPPGPVTGYFLYYNGSAFVWSTTVWSFDTLHIAYVYYDPAGTFRFAIRETHGLMPWQAHREMHETIGTYKRGGGGLSSYVLSSTVAANRRPDVASTVIADEDLETTNPALTSKSYTHLYLTGAGTSTFSTAQAEIIPVTGAVPYYNQFTGGNWVQTAVPPAQYTSVFLVAIPATADSGSQGYRFLWLQGQSVGTLANEQAFDFHDMNLGQLTSAATEFVPIAKIIVRNTGADWELTSVEMLSVTRVAASTAAGNFLTSVVTDTTLTGIGTPTSPLGLSGTTPNTFTITNATASTSTTTGALVVTGGVGVTGAVYVGGDIVRNVASGTAYVKYRQGGLDRWWLGKTSTAETGANAGSNFAVNRYDDAGVFISSPLLITRSTGVVSFPDGINVTNTTVSTSPTTGALIVAGGVGISGTAYIGGNLNVSGTGIMLGANGNALTGFTINASAASSKTLVMQSAGLNRWVMSCGTAEGGGDTGSNWALGARNDAGGVIDAAITIIRAAGGPVTISTARPFVSGPHTAPTLTTTAYTVATLPTGAAGMRSFVTDANATTFASVVAGGGANPVPVYYDGANWRIG